MSPQVVSCYTWVLWVNSARKETLKECLYDHACPSVRMWIHVALALIMYMCLQWWLRGPDSCSVVWWSSPSGEGAVGWHPSHWPPSGSPVPLYSLPTSHIPGLNHTMSPCLSPLPHNSTYNTQSSGHTECKIMYTPPPKPACSNAPDKGSRYSTMKRIHPVKF